MNIDFVIQLFGLQLNLSGFIVGLATFIAIAFGHWACIAGEYYFTKRFWVFFLISGLLFLVLALLSENMVLAASLCIAGFSMMWGIGEIIEQEKRVEKGWFPKNPKRM
ncbi:MAG: DUF4491 family protein [Bacteroidales bacterium]|nr:DUF4491 family protein [Bacteroidales bacterium]